MIRPPKGFSLLEILVAFAIMAVALTIVLRIFGTGVNNAILSEEYTLAVQIAESLLAGAGVETPLELGETSGDVGKYHWRLTVNTVRLPVMNTNNNQAPAAAQNPSQPPIEPQPMFAVQAQVAWGDEGRELRSIEISNLKIQ